MFLIKCDGCENLRSKFINYSSNFPSVFSVILIPKSVFLHYVADTYIIAYSTVYSDTNKAVIAMISAMPSSGLEPETSPLPRECSTAELQGQF